MSANSQSDFAKNIDFHAFSTPSEQQKCPSSTAIEMINQIYSSDDSLSKNSFQEDSLRDSQKYESLHHFDPQPPHFLDQESQFEHYEHYSQQWEVNQHPLEEWNGQQYQYQEQSNHPECENVLPNENEMEPLILSDDQQINMGSLFGPDTSSANPNQLDQVEMYFEQQDCWEEDSMQGLQPQVITSPSDIKQESVGCQTLPGQPSYLEFSRQKRLKKKNCMGNNSCEETKNFFNHIVPFIEKNISTQWIRLLKIFKKKGNHKSLRFLDDLAKEVDSLDLPLKEEFKNDFEDLIKNDVRIWAMNHIKLETTFIILKYSDTLITIMNNPGYFTSIKKAKEVHSALQNNQQI